MNEIFNTWATGKSYEADQQRVVHAGAVRGAVHSSVARLYRA
jgi:hypothetical protein